ncbi:MAG: nucleoside-diphosphate sugar epimerase/dehydratase [Kiritimatiellia bacterium]
MTDLAIRLAAFVRRNLLLRKAVILGWHVAGIVLAYYAAYLLRFDGAVPGRYLTIFAKTLPALLIINIIVFAVFRLYSGIWAYFSIHDVLRIIGAVGTSFVVFMPTVYVMMGRSFAGYPRSTALMGFILLAVWMVGGRLSIRLIREHRAAQTAAKGTSDGTRALIVGNLPDVDHLIHSLPSQAPGIGRVAAIVTDEEDRHNLVMRGIPVRGAVRDIGRIARQDEVDSVLILPPYTRPKLMNEIVRNCEKEDVVCSFRMIPSMADLASGRIEASTIRKVELEDLLDRPEIKFDREAVKEMLSGKTVMVTGAGGSVGSELVRQIARYEPASLVLLENNEYNLYAIDMELRETSGGPAIIPVTGDVADSELVRRVFVKHKVNVIFHAAAYKHVPLMESNVTACITNNTLGTARLAAEAEEAGIERFVLVSTDKAVRPTSVMGASKRLAERLLQERPDSSTTFVIVRFGNVLGSSGSVVPLFKRQIAAGGPVTVTSEKATRFFMSIPEAVDLMLQAGVIGRNREIMALEMGQSVRVMDLARHLIELSGMKVGEDIAIEITGLRPGEKEFEEVMTDDENVVRTPFEKIWVVQSKGNHSASAIDTDRIGRLVASQDEERIREEMARLIPEATLGSG